MDITQYLSECVKHKISVSFLKFGDGEYNCAISYYGHNCDNDNYTSKKKDAMLESFKYMVNESHNAHIGLWHELEKKQFWEFMASKPIRWAKYHTIIFDKNNDESKVKLYKEIKNSDMNKIIICNELLMKTKTLFNADHIIHIPFNNWFDTEYEVYSTLIKNIIMNDPRPPLVITSCGMNAKILICDLYKTNPNGIYLDFGSALDFLCTKRDSRGVSYSYEYLTDSLHEVLPSDWESDKYKNIYEQAQYKMGLHLPR